MFPNIVTMQRQDFDEWVNNASKFNLGVAIMAVTIHLQFMSPEDGDQYEEFLLLNGRKKVMEEKFLTLK